MYYAAYLTSANVTVEIITQITTEITTVIEVAIGQVGAIVTSPLDIIVGLLDISVVGQLIGSLIVVSWHCRLLLAISELVFSDCLLCSWCLPHLDHQCQRRHRR